MDSLEYESKVHLIQANLQEVPIINSSFDFIHCAGVLHHTHDTYKGFSELSIKVKPKGKLYIEVYQ